MNHTPNYCSHCGWTHNKVSILKVVEDGHTTVLRPLCEGCKPTVSIVECFNCGKAVGSKLYPTTITLKIFEDNSSCDVSVSLCESCKTINHKELIRRNETKLTAAEKLCFTCPKRFSCFSLKEKHGSAQSATRYHHNTGKFFESNLRKG